MKTLKSSFSLLFLAYLRFWAKKQLAKNPRAVIIGITGSAGKTSTRLALLEVLRSSGTVKHSAHANSESGIPLNILGLKLSDYSALSWFKVLLLAPYQYATFNEKFDYYIVEMGIDSPNPPKNMGYLLTIIKPDVAIIQGISLAHAAAFDHLVKDSSPSRKEVKLKRLIAKEKMRLAHSISPHGTVICSADDPYIRAELKDVVARVLTFGYHKNSDYRIRRYQLNSRGTNLSYTTNKREYFVSFSQPFGAEYSHTFLSAIAAAHSLGVGHQKAHRALQQYRAPAGRMRIFKGINNTHLIDSSYNSSPPSIQNALSTLKKLGGSKTMAVLGDMRELGVLSKREHQHLASLIPEYTQTVILFGPAMRDYVLPLLLRKKGVKVTYGATMPELISLLRRQLKPGHWVLFKGSQNTILLERAVESMLADPKDIRFLPRRGPYWDQIRSITP